MPTAKNDTDNSSNNDGKNEQERISALIQAIRTEMATLTPEEIERLYAVVALMETPKDE